MSTFVANCKAIAGRTSNCQVMAGRSKKICKVFLGRDIRCTVSLYNVAKCRFVTLQSVALQRCTMSLCNITH
jgi:hypothetical protein